MAALSEMKENVSSQGGLSATGMAYVIVMCTLLAMGLIVMLMKLLSIGQKTRDPQPRRVYVGTRASPSISQQSPTIYVSPANYPPPPKYEAMAPPSYEEVVGVHYPQYQPPINSSIQPITQPIATAVATHNTQTSIAMPDVSSSTNQGSASTRVTVTSDDRRTSVTVASSG